MDHLPYRCVWAVDFEYTAPTGARPVPLCVVARELRTGRLVRRWLEDETGLDHYQVRGYTAWYRHITLSMAAAAFLTILRRDTEKGIFTRFR